MFAGRKASIEFGRGGGCLGGAFAGELACAEQATWACRERSSKQPPIPQYAQVAD